MIKDKLVFTCKKNYKILNIFLKPGIFVALIQGKLHCIGIWQMYYCYAAYFGDSSTGVHGQPTTVCDHLNLTIHGAATDFPWGKRNLKSLGSNCVVHFVTWMPACAWLRQLRGAVDRQKQSRLASEISQNQKRISSENKLQRGLYHTSESQNSKTK